MAVASWCLPPWWAPSPERRRYSSTALSIPSWSSREQSRQARSRPQVPSKSCSISSRIFDLFLLGTVMLIMALSLYELFFGSDLKLPARLEIHTFEDLKSNLVTVVIVVMAVTFLGQIVSWNGEADLFGFGVVVALVIAALNFYLWIVKRSKKEEV